MNLRISWFLPQTLPSMLLPPVEIKKRYFENSCDMVGCWKIENMLKECKTLIKNQLHQIMQYMMFFLFWNTHFSITKYLSTHNNAVFTLLCGNVKHTIIIPSQHDIYIFFIIIIIIIRDAKENGWIIPHHYAMTFLGI